MPDPPPPPSPQPDAHVLSHIRVLAARNLARWHDASVRALGLRPTFTDSWWCCAMAAPNIYHSAISLRPARDSADRNAIMDELREHLDDPDSSYVSICDSYDELPLATLGLDRRAEAPWCIRWPALLAPMPSAASPFDGVPLAIEVVDTDDHLAVFEATMVAGFGARPPVAPFDIHAPAVLRDESMTLLLGRTTVDLGSIPAGDAVSVSMSYVYDEMNGIYGVATVPGARSHGFATAMTVAALDVAPEVPAMLQPSAAALPIYRRLGFEDVGWFSHWG